MQKTGECIDCGKFRPLNYKGRCSDCQFKLNHDGKSRSEVYSERNKDKPVKIYVPKKKSVKSSKTSAKVRSEKLEKIRERIRKDEETYEAVFYLNPNSCEECGTPLPDVFRDAEGFVLMRNQYSHIHTKSSHPELRNDPRNFNRLCGSCHNKWEFGDRESMRIYPKNKEYMEKSIK